MTEKNKPLVRLAHLSTWKAYDRGMAARMRGKPYNSNPYKSPGANLSWSLGWRDFPASYTGESVLRKRLLKHLRSM